MSNRLNQFQLLVLIILTACTNNQHADSPTQAPAKQFKTIHSSVIFRVPLLIQTSIGW